MKRTMMLAGIAAVLAAGIAAGSANAQQQAVKVGVLTDMSSLYADATGKGSVAAVEMAVADYGGKVKGKPIQVVVADHQNKPDVGVSIARNWYDNDKVDAILDVPTSSVALPISALTREKNKIHINSGGGSSDITGTACSPNTVHWTYDTYALSNVAGKAMVKRGEDTWFFVTADYAFGMALQRVPVHGLLAVQGERHPRHRADARRDEDAAGVHRLPGQRLGPTPRAADDEPVAVDVLPGAAGGQVDDEHDREVHRGCDAPRPDDERERGPAGGKPGHHRAEPDADEREEGERAAPGPGADPAPEGREQRSHVGRTGS